MAIRTLDYFDLKEDDDYNLKLLHECHIRELANDCNLLNLAYKGQCQKFVSTVTVQKTIHIMWQRYDFANFLVELVEQISLEIRKVDPIGKIQAPAVRRKYNICFM